MAHELFNNIVIAGEQDEGSQCGSQGEVRVQPQETAERYIAAEEDCH